MAHAEDDNDKVWNLAEKIGFCMLATQFGTDLKARPMAAYAERIENAYGRRRPQGRGGVSPSERLPRLCRFQGPEIRVDLGRRRGAERPRKDPGPLGDTGQGLVGQPRRSVHPHPQGHAVLGGILGQPRNGDQLHQDGRRRRDQFETRHGRERQGPDVTARM